ncbi:carbamoyltransferase HypF [Novosphingobium mangrovi (ex Hu et al. 2023)]|uniref:Carbamoyltransferase HypF n=1 Tax=Novosphingobium mangrovi (ex Hu et al. 2023) TaxID=2930094 RepID=A0ABT0ADL1_9SPHN|nr:carbamoyltransferase HypF [Novosphingobium mangrovi (ex Hu et al. 2023)]MCJ1961254.1 carbamoyltransferase HypF [Novosphingobium mangrovi (ex Hu et al. 2023)]
MARAADPLTVDRSYRTLRVRGQVQAVGYRPFVWQCARALGLAGDVANDGEGVLVRVAGPSEALDRFEARLRHEAPPLARVFSVEVVDTAPFACGEDFAIARSGGGAVTTGIVPDAATCPACRAELRDPDDRRHGYAFGNCTHCGPRLSIMSALPYDRARTSMADFALCEPCAREYADPADRRFHAQPIACPACGPQLELSGEGEGAPDPLAASVDLLRMGRIVAIKGLGGYHLACLASDAGVVANLRSRKARDAKPFAVMVPSLTAARELCEVSDEAAQALESPAAPIVLLPLRQDGAALPERVAPGQDHLGLLLPYTPLHHLLMDALQAPLVMTSGNRSDEPQVTDDGEARTKLAGIADAWLGHDRAIVNRIDDSVMAFDARGPVVLRRARGLAPDPILLPESLAAPVPILAMGGELKATFCLLRGREAVLSPHIGDLEDAVARADYRRMLDLFCDLYAFTPGAIAVDGHPDYASTRIGSALAHERGLPLVTVDHHHAHLAACLAENGIAAGGTVTALVCDGLGLGGDGTLWGGEVLRGGYGRAARTGALPAVALPGGAAAMKQPWRNLLAHLRHAFGDAWADAVPLLAERVPAGPSRQVLQRAIAQGLNSPVCSSGGRLFDAVAAALDLCGPSISHEGEAAMALEAAARPFVTGETGYPFGLARDAAGLARLDFAHLWQALARDLGAGVPVGPIAARFHLGLADALVALASAGEASLSHGRVALSGGVFNNRILREAVAQRIEDMGAVPLVHHRVPAGDGGLSLGQVVVAAARLDGDWQEDTGTC